MNRPKQHTLWLLAALAAPISHFSGAGWFTSAVTACIILPVTLLPGSWDDLPKPLAYLEVIWLGAVAGMLLPGSAACWPSDNTLVVPLTLLALAAFTNSPAAPRIGAVLTLCMGLLFVPLLLSSASRLEYPWLAPAAQPMSPGLALTMLLPALPAAGGKRRGSRAVSAAALTILLSALVQGVMSAPAAAAVPDPFYETARTLGHMEPVAAAAATLGWYALACFLLQSALQTAKNSGIGRKWASVLVLGTTAVSVIFQQQPNGRFVIVISLFLWVIAPFLHKINLFEKSEK